MNGLLREMLGAVDALTSLDVQRAKVLGIANHGVIEFGRIAPPFGVMAIENAGQGLFRPSLTGKRALVVPVVERGEIVDLCAFFSQQPEDWLLRTGLGWALGEDALSRAMWGEVPELHRTPLDWLRAGCAGMCVVDWEAPEVRFLNDFKQVLCADGDVASLVRKALTKPVHLPQIIIKGNDLAAAA